MPEQGRRGLERVEVAAAGDERDGEMLESTSRPPARELSALISRPWDGLAGIGGILPSIVSEISVTTCYRRFMDRLIRLRLELAWPLRFADDRRVAGPGVRGVSS